MSALLVSMRIYHVRFSIWLTRVMRLADGGVFFSSVQVCVELVPEKKRRRKKGMNMGDWFAE